MLEHKQERVLLYKAVTVTDLKVVLQRENNIGFFWEQFFGFLYTILDSLL